MSSFIVSNTDSNSTSSSSPISHRIDENTIRQAMHQLFLRDNIHDSLSPGNDGDDNNVHSPLSSPKSLRSNRAKFTSISSFLLRYFLLFIQNIIFQGELLLEWIKLNSESGNSNTQALIQQVKSCLHPKHNISSNKNNIQKVY